MNSLQRKLDAAIRRNFFSDYQLSVRGSRHMDIWGGHFQSQFRGAKLFDISSITKALAYLVMLKLFNSGALSPETFFETILPNVPNTNGRQLRHFMSYVVQEYGFDFRGLKHGTVGPFKKTLLEQGFGTWKKNFDHDNFSSAFVGLALEKIFGMDIEEILHKELCEDKYQMDNLLFHPVRRGLVRPEFVVPSKWDLSVRGLVHDPLSASHQDEHIVAAGVFSRASVLADIFHETIGQFIKSGFYKVMSANQLEGFGIPKDEHDYGLGFDIPWQRSLEGVTVKNPLLFAGFTGCRIFFAEEPRITVCLLTNRTFYRDKEDTRIDFSAFAWDIIREAIQRGGGGGGGSNSTSFVLYVCSVYSIHVREKLRVLLSCQEKPVTRCKKSSSNCRGITEKLSSACVGGVWQGNGFSDMYARGFGVRRDCE